ncbi:DUF4124 domain-containing protein [Pseudomonas gingeri]|uniref:DUF4124 domain-containing protein n=1 Tax=Pseudomonas gingeri TaxID=117681 RepID=A0A7Y8C6A0_9PSED|nr:DUF4124 domain-containing protein [Pseudomonas gingeri]NWA29114.1 DUF4124 domain-containing protein [Pseudomonas gingeri]NWC00685.1 DUF4124 domain-containing protein [Pseudomonas gingeri]NWD66015.1 DUF4124 domain-containing protein [Pseudomonas gingeri]
MRRSILMTGLLFALSPLCQAGQIYKWVDAQGQTHFDAQPPTGQTATLVTPAIGNVPAPPPPPAVPVSSPVGDQQAVDAKVKKQIADQEVVRKAYCEKARTNLAQLENNARVREEVNGQLHRLSEEERQTRLVETRKTIQDNCS